VTRRLLPAGKVILVTLWFGLVLAGMVIILEPGGYYSPPVGWVLLLVAAVIFFVTMDRWVKALPGLIALGALRSCLTIFTGHLPEKPEKLIPTLEAIAMTAFLIASAFLIFTFGERKLTKPHRVALFAWMFSFFWSMTNEPKTLIAVSVSFVFLVLAWGFDLFQRRRRPAAGRRVPTSTS